MADMKLALAVADLRNAKCLRAWGPDFAEPKAFPQDFS